MHTHKAVKKSWRVARMQFSIIKTHNIEPDSMSLSWSTLTAFSRAPKAFPRHHKTPHGDRSRCRSIGSCGSGACQIAFSSEVQPQTSSVTTSLIVTTYTLQRLFKTGNTSPRPWILGTPFEASQMGCSARHKQSELYIFWEKNDWKTYEEQFHNYPLRTHYNHL